MHVIAERENLLLERTSALRAVGEQFVHSRDRSVKVGEQIGERSSEATIAESVFSGPFVVCCGLDEVGVVLPSVC